MVNLPCYQIPGRGGISADSINPYRADRTILRNGGAVVQVLRVLSEPTAAAMAYGMHKKTGQNFLIVFDFGGGTLVRCASRLFLVSGTAQNTRHLLKSL